MHGLDSGQPAQVITLQKLYSKKSFEAKDFANQQTFLLITLDTTFTLVSPGPKAKFPVTPSPLLAPSPCFGLPAEEENPVIKGLFGREILPSPGAYKGSSLRTAPSLVCTYHHLYKHPLWLPPGKTRCQGQSKGEALKAQR